MSDKPILRFEVDSSEYDNKVKKAGRALLELEQGARKAGATFDNTDDKVLAFAKALGSMDTESKSSKQQLRELTNTLTDLTAVYRRLSDQEKNSPVGKALAQSMQQLTERAGQVRDAMEDVQRSVQGAASDTRTFDQIAQGASVATASFQTLTGVGKMLGLEMGDNVELLAKLQAALAVTNGLTTIQTALQKESALMMGVAAVQAKALSASQALVGKETAAATLAQKAFNLIAKANPYLLLAGAIGGLAAAFGILGSQSRKAAKEQKALSNEIENTKTQIDNIGKDLDFNVAIAEAAGKSWKAIHALRLEAARTKLQLADMAYDKVRAAGGTPEQIAEAASMSQAAWDNVMKVLNEGTIHEVQMRNGGGGGGRGSRGGTTAPLTGLINTQQNLVNDLQTKRAAASTIEELVALTYQLDEAQKRLEMLQNVGKEATKELGDTVITGTLPPLMKMNEVLDELNKKLATAKTPEAYQNILADIKAVNEEIATFKGESGTGGNEAKMSTTQAVGQLVGSVNSIASGLERLGIEIPKGFSDVLSGMQTVILILEAIKTIDTVGSILGIFNGGGIVHAAGGRIIGGNSFSGDNIYAGNAWVNAGELVLNRAQQGNLASQLRDGGNGAGYASQPYVNGEQIWLGMSTYLKRSGKGEIVLTR